MGWRVQDLGLRVPFTNVDLPAASQTWRGGSRQAGVREPVVLPGEEGREERLVGWSKGKARQSA